MVMRTMPQTIDSLCIGCKEPLEWDDVGFREHAVVISCWCKACHAPCEIIITPKGEEA